MKSPMSRLTHWTQTKPYLGIVAVLCVLCMVFWFPALFGGRTLLHGDTVVHGVPLLMRQNAFMHGHAPLSWDSGIYGGHPLFAEGQGGYADPVNVLFAFLVMPFVGVITTLTWLHAMLMVLGGLGTVGLARQLRLGFSASLYIVVTFVFSVGMTGIINNLTISDAVVCIPFVLWATEYWVERVSLWSGIALGASFAWALLGGYPETVHALALYVSIRLVIAPPKNWYRRSKEISLSLLAGVVTALGLSAIQWLPLLELVAQSHRSGGVGLAFPCLRIGYLSAELFSYIWPTRPTGFLGSMTACLLAPLAIFVPRKSLVAAHLTATIGMLILGTEYANPIFPLIYDHNLLPGLHFFRVVQIYCLVSCMGLAVLGGLAVESLGASIYMRMGMWFSLPLWILAADLVTIPPWNWWGQVLCAIAAVLGAQILVRVRQSAYVAPFLALLMLTETLAYRMSPFPFFDRQILARQPENISQIKHDDDWRDQRISENAWLISVGLIPPQRPDYARLVRANLATGGGMSAQIWGLGSLDGALALQLRRRDMAQPILAAEMDGRSAAPPGQRLIDLMGVTQLAIYRDCAALHMVLTTKIQAIDPVNICANANARPRLQLFTESVSTQSATNALPLVAAGKVLVIEQADGLPPVPAATIAHDAPKPPTLKIKKSNDLLYSAQVVAQTPAWLFVADSYYPGWEATIDGKPVPLYPAQLLGKAVYVPPGSHHVMVRYVPRLLYAGALITALTTLALLGGLFYTRSRQAAPRYRIVQS